MPCTRAFIFIHLLGLSAPKHQMCKFGRRCGHRRESAEADTQHGASRRVKVAHRPAEEEGYAKIVVDVVGAAGFEPDNLSLKGRQAVQAATAGNLELGRKSRGK